MKLFSVLLVAVSLLLSACSQEISTEEYIKRGQDYYSKKEWKSALIEFKNAVKQNPGSAQARALLGKTYLETYSSDAAIKELLKAMELGHDRNDVIIFLGKAYQQGNDLQKIIDEVFVSSDQSEDLQAKIHAVRALAHMGLKNMDAAAKELEKAQRQDKNETDVRLAWAIYAKLNNDKEEQIRWLKPLLERNGGVADAWSQMGEIEQQAVRLDAAEKAYSRSIELRQLVHYDYIRRSLVRIAKQDYEGAKADIDVLKKAGANWPMVDYAEGLMAYQNNKYDEAQTHFSSVLKKNSNYTPAQLMMALTHYNKNNFQNAIASLEQYLSKNPDEYRANMVYAASLMKIRDVDQAIQVLNKLRRQKPDDFKVLSMLGNAYIAEREYEKGIKVLQHAASLQPDQAGIRLQLGSALLQQPSTLDLGQQELIKATELDPELHQAELALYMSYMREKKFEEARQSATRLQQAQKDQPLGANLIAMTYLADGKKAQATELLLNTLKRFPADILTSHNIAQLYLQQDELAKASELYKNVLQKQPGHVKTLNQLALIAAREGKREEVIEWLKIAVDKNPGLLSSKLLLATQYLRNSKPNQTIQLLNQVEQEQKSEPAYILLMARAKMSVKEHEHAIRSLKSLIEQSPNLSAAHFLLAQAYGYMNNADQMRSSLDKTLQLEPAHFSANIMLAKLDLLQGNKDVFSKRVKMLEQNYPDNPNVKFLRAKLVASNKNYADAIDTLSSLMKETPHSEVITDLAKNQWQAGNRQAAISSLELWMQDHDDDSRALLLLAQFYLGDNRIEEAKNIYQKLDNLVPDNAIVLNNLAWLMKDVDVPKGINYGKRALQLDSGNPYIMDTLAMLYLASGENKEALQLATKAANLAPDFVEIQINYARVMSANKRTDDAKKLLQKLLKNTRSTEQERMIRLELDKL